MKNSDGIVRYFEKGHDAEGIYITEEYIDGKTLVSSVNEKGPLSRKEAVVIFREIAGAVAYLHGKSIVHCDLKPENVMLTRQGQHAKIIDLALASQYSYKTSAAGTPGFSAPEQFLSPEETGVRSDIFALGQLLEFMAPGVFRKVVRKACAHDPSKRYSCVEQMLSAVDGRKQRGFWFAATAVGLVAAASGLSLTLSQLMPHQSLGPARVDTVYVKDTLLIRDTVVMTEAPMPPSACELFREAVRKELAALYAPFYASYDIIDATNYERVNRAYQACFARSMSVCDSLSALWDGRPDLSEADRSRIVLEEQAGAYGKYLFDLGKM